MDKNTDTEIVLNKPLTPRQAKLFKLLQEKDDSELGAESISAIMVQAGYSPATAKTPSKIVRQQPFQQFFQTKISRNMVISAHKKLLKAKVKVRTYKKGELTTEYESEDTLGLSKGVDLAYKVMGAFAPVETKHTITGLEAKSDDELEQLMQEEHETLKRSNKHKPKAIEGEVID